MRLQESNGSFFIHIPIAIIRGKGWDKGDKLRVIIMPNGDIGLKEIGRKSENQIKPKIVGFRMEVDDIDKLKRISEKRGVSASDFIRESIEKHMPEESKKYE